MSEELSATGWVGADPRTSADAPFLLLSTSSTAREQMRTLAASLGLAIGSMTPYPDGVTAVLTGEHVTVCSGDQVLAERPVTIEWAQSARSYDAVVLVLGIDPLASADTMQQLDAYLAHNSTALALVPVRPAG